MSEENKKKRIRNSTAEFLIFTGQSGDQSIEARCEDETIWLSQKLMVRLFDANELAKVSVIRSSRITETIGKSYATSEFDEYGIVQDRLFESDFDKAVKVIEEGDGDDGNA